MTGVSANPNTEREDMIAIPPMPHTDYIITTEGTFTAEYVALLARAIRLASEEIARSRRREATRISSDDPPVDPESVLAGLLREATKT